MVVILLLKCTLLKDKGSFAMAPRPITASKVDASTLTMDFYICVLREDVQTISTNGFLRPFQVTGHLKNHIGLRESKRDAYDRATKIYLHMGDLENQVAFLQITFTAAGLAYFTQQLAGPKENFASKFHKRVYYSDSETDWKTWYFLGNLPLNCTDETTDTILVSSQWID